MKRVPNMMFPVMWVEESKLSRFRTRSYFQKMINSESNADAPTSQTFLKSEMESEYSTEIEDDED